MPISIRPGGTEAPLYNPQRDIGYLYSAIAKAAFAGLDQINWEPWFEGYLESTKTTQEDLAEGIKRFAEAHFDFVRDPLERSPIAALERHKFFDLPYPVRILLYARLGEVLLGMFFQAVKEVTPLLKDPPEAVDMDGLVAMGRAVATRITGEVSLPGELELAYQRALIDSERYRRKLVAAEEEIECLKRSPPSP